MSERVDVTEANPRHVWLEYERPELHAPYDEAGATDYAVVECRSYEYRCPLCDAFWRQTARGAEGVPYPKHPLTPWKRQCDGGLNHD